MQNDILTAIANASASGAFTKLEARIAAFFLSRPEALVMETSAAIAQKLDISPMTVTRFFKKVGYESSAEARANSMEHIFGANSDRIGLRFQRFNDGAPKDDPETDFKVGMSGLRHAMEIRQNDAWTNTVKLAATSDSVYVIGYQTMRYLADGLSMRLQYVRENVHLLDGGDGVYASLLSDPAPSRLLIMIDTFRYAAQGPLLAEAAVNRGIDLVVFCDEFCEWAVKWTKNIHVFPSESHFFIGMPVGVSFSLNLLVQDIIKMRGKRVKDQIEILSCAQEMFGQFLR